MYRHAGAGWRSRASADSRDVIAYRAAAHPLRPPLHAAHHTRILRVELLPRDANVERAVVHADERLDVD